MAVFFFSISASDDIHCFCVKMSSDEGNVLVAWIRKQEVKKTRNPYCNISGELVSFVVARKVD